MEKESLNFIERDIIESVARGQAIITRYPPEPNGYMHIGHAKAFGLDYWMAKKYGGYTNLRFDDTNPEKEDMEYVDAMMLDMKWLGLTWKNLLFASDYYEDLYKMAQTLIKKGLAYVDFQTADEISKNRGTLTSPGIDSPFRNTGIQENMELFQKMRDGEFADGHCVLRAKIDMAHGNMNMRDPVMYRIMREKHYRTGDTWCIYPLYDFAHPLSDAFENISHSICSLEYDDHRIIYDWYITNCLEMKNPPRQFEFSRLNIEQTIMSKRYLKKLVDSRVVDGWDDPRMPTISGMRRRGYPAQSIMDFVMSTGVSRTPMTVSLGALEYYVRTHLDKAATRVSVVFNQVKVIITNYDKGVEKLEIANNPHDESAGKHEIHFGRELYIDGDDFALVPPPKYKRLIAGGTVRLRGAYIIKCDRVVQDKKGGISHLECTYYPESKSGSDTSGIKPDGTIHFVESSQAVEITVNEFFPLLREGTSLEDENINKDSMVVHKALAEGYIKNVKLGQPLQFVRKGFYMMDKNSNKDEMIFNMTVGLKEGK
ncbi:MAG: glutamine--tRNA ligase [Firmicutes bacterium]|nr:glutamine--tRNA ligase [Bacillota bacterium]